MKTSISGPFFGTMKRTFRGSTHTNLAGQNGKFFACASEEAAA
jgi:hypothetical protein